jgi:hypothetical protein
MSLFLEYMAVYATVAIAILLPCTYFLSRIMEQIPDPFFFGAIINLTITVVAAVFDGIKLLWLPLLIVGLVGLVVWLMKKGNIDFHMAPAFLCLLCKAPE